MDKKFRYLLGVLLLNFVPAISYALSCVAPTTFFEALEMDKNHQSMLVISGIGVGEGVPGGQINLLPDRIVMNDVLKRSSVSIVDQDGIVVIDQHIGYILPVVQPGERVIILAYHDETKGLHTPFCNPQLLKTDKQMVHFPVLYNRKINEWEETPPPPMPLSKFWDKVEASWAR